MHPDEESGPSNAAGLTNGLKKPVVKKEIGLPFLLPLDELKRRFPDLEIGFASESESDNELFERKRRPQTNGLITNNKVQNGVNNAHYGGDTSDDNNILKVSLPRRPLKKTTTKKGRQGSPLKEEQLKQGTPTTKTASPKRGRISERAAKNKEYKRLNLKAKDDKEKAKPGTMGSFQEMIPKSSTRRKSEKEKEKWAKFAELHSINTNFIVEDTMIVFVSEFAQWAELDSIPRDPTKLCKSFQVELPHLHLDSPVKNPRTEEMERWAALQECL